MQILQGSPQWLEAKQSTIGASEIFSLIHHYCAKELQDLGFDLVKERPFRTVQEMFLKVKFGAKLSAIDPVHSQFGNGLEPYVAYRLGQELPQVNIERSKEFITNPEFHPLAACSPDGYVELQCLDDGSAFVEDFDKTCRIFESWNKGALELKTANFFANFDQGGSRLQYILQLQYQLAVMDLKWGCLAVLLPKEKEFDDPFFKGQILEKVRRHYDVEKEMAKMGYNDASDSFVFRSEIDQFYDLKHYIYPVIPAFQALIKKALNCFQRDLDAYPEDQTAFPRNSEDLTGLQREKQLWGQVFSDHNSTLEINPESKLNQLFNERYQLQIASMFADQDKLRVENEINQLVKAEGLDKYCELRGDKNRMMWIKNGQIRFYPLKGVEQ